MEIISLSLDKELLVELKEAQKKLGFNSRSKVLREGIRALLKDYVSLESLPDPVTLVITLVHDHGGERFVTELTHEFEHLIESRLHKTAKNGCVEILIIEGKAKDAKELVKKLKASKQLKAVFYYPV